MRLPSLINYKNSKISLKYMDKPTSDKEKALGIYDPHIRTILIYKNLNKKELLNTVLHELIHLIGDRSRYKIRNFSEEKVCNMVGDELGYIFCKNPKIINFIKRCVND